METYSKRRNVHSHFVKSVKVRMGRKHDIRSTLKSAFRCFPLVLIIALFTDSSRALALFIEEQTLPAAAWSVAINETRLIIGAPAEDSEKGAVYVYRYNNDTRTWQQEQKLIAADGEIGDQFGFSVAMFDNRIIVGAPLDQDNGTASGSAYVFRFQPELMTWLQEQKIIASDGAPFDFFGYSTAIGTNRAFIGSPLDDDKGSRSGAVYVYKVDPQTRIWTLEDKLLASDGKEEGHLGISVAIEGDRIVAGAYLDRHNDVQSGSAYLFRYDIGLADWIEEEKLTPPDGHDFGLFGISVGVSHERIVVGTQQVGPDGKSAAYVFRYNDGTMAWGQEQKLTASHSRHGDTFGYAVAIHGDTIVAGDPFTSTDTAYVFQFDDETMSWTQKQQLTASGGSSGNRFGLSVALAGDLIAVASNVAAYIFRFAPDSDGDGVPDEQDQCPLSDTRPTVIVGTCDSGVGNILLPEPTGCTISDEILKLADNANSHGQFVSQVDKFLLELQKAGILEAKEKSRIKDCAAQSTLP